MIGENALNKKITAKQSTVTNFDPLPKGEYDAIIEKVDDWKQTTRNIFVNKRDERGYVIKDAKGKTIKENVNNATLFEATITFRIIGGEFEGRKLWLDLSTHPDLEFRTEHLLWALGIEEVSLGDIQEKCKDKLVKLNVDVTTYDKKVVDKLTGIETLVPTTKNVIKGFAKSTLVADSAATVIEDLGI